MSFEPFYINNQYETLAFPNTTEQIISAYKKRGLKNIIIANTGHMYQSTEIYRQMSESGLKPGIGVILGDFLLVAKNLDGYKEITNLITQKNTKQEIIKIESENVITIEKNKIDKIDFIDDDDFDAFLFLNNIKNANRDGFLSLDDVLDKNSEQNNDNFFDEIMKFEIPFSNKPSLPSLGGTNKLIDLIKNEIKNRNLSDEYINRLNLEIKVIDELNFSDYFLVVKNIIDFIKREDILINSGRGSVGGSLIAFVLGITDIDPIEYGLFFERFLNKDRSHMPDIDIDIPSEKRKYVLNYIAKQFGEGKTSQIITYNTYQEKSSNQDLSIFFGLNEVEKNELSSGKIKQLSKEKLERINSIKNKIINLPKSVGIHAAGVLISDETLSNISSLSDVSSAELPVFELDKEESEENSLVKFDFLSLVNLDYVSKIKEKINSQFSRKLSLSKINLNDLKTIDILNNGITKGVFQFETNSATSLIKKIRPQNFSDFVAINALNRPGAIDNADLYADLKNNRIQLKQTNSVYDRITKETYGIILYQEQVMQIAQELAGMSGEQSDIFRSAISSKNLKIFEKQRELFFQGAKSNNYSNDLIEYVFNQIEKFAGYGFNKSHAVAYTKFSFQMAFLKAHFTDIFYSVMLQNTSYKEYRSELRYFGISLSVPDIFLAEVEFASDKDNKNKINVGLSSIKGISYKTAEEIFNFVHQNDFPNNRQFVIELQKKFPQQFNNMVYAGFLDKYIPSRNSFYDFENKKEIFSNLSIILQVKKSSPTDLQRHILETEALGFSTVKLTKVETLNSLKISDLTDLVGNSIDITGKVKLFENSIKNDKNGRQYQTFSLSDETGLIGVTLFADEYQKFGNLVKNSAVITINGKIEEYSGKTRLIVNNIRNK